MKCIPVQQGKQTNHCGSVKGQAVSITCRPTILLILMLFKAPYSMVSTPDHDLHRQRRNAVNSFFSIASIRRLEPIMKEFLGKMFKHMDNASASGKIVQMHALFKACASDVITQYAFGECLHFLDQSDCGKPYFDATDWFFYLTHVFGLFPGLVAQAQTCPGWVIRIIAPFLSALRDRQDVCTTPMLPELSLTLVLV